MQDCRKPKRKIASAGIDSVNKTVQMHSDEALWTTSGGLHGQEYKHRTQHQSPDRLRGTLQWTHKQPWAWHPLRWSCLWVLACGRDLWMTWRPWTCGKASVPRRRSRCSLSGQSQGIWFFRIWLKERRKFHHEID